VDESGVWARAGDRDAGVWRARQQGSSVTAARVGLSTSKRLASLDATARAVRRGDLSVPQVESIADAAAQAQKSQNARTAVPDNSSNVEDTDEAKATERRLLGLAGEASLGELRQECGRVKLKADPDPEARQRRIRVNRRFRQGANSEGAWSLFGVGPVEDGGELKAVLGPIIDELFHEARGEGREETRDAYAWDALIEMARRAHHWVYGDTAPDIDTDVRDDDDERDRPGPERHNTHDAGTHDRTGDMNGERSAGSDGSDMPVGGADDSDPRDVGAPTDDVDVDGVPAGATDGGHTPETQPIHSGDETAVDDGGSRDGGPPSAAPGLFDPPGTTNSDLRSSQKPTVRTPRPGHRKRMNEKYLTLVRVDLDALARGHMDDGEVCEIAGVTVPVSVARDVLGESVLKLVLTKGQDVMSITHLGRGPTAAQRIALRWLSPTCSVLGCNRTDLQHDHRDDWRYTHHTRLDEMDELCTWHHHLKTTKGWALVPGTGKRPMVPPEDPHHPRHHLPTTATTRPAATTHMPEHDIVTSTCSSPNPAQPATAPRPEQRSRSQVAVAA
jgi:hypothetical protein